MAIPKTLLAALAVSATLLLAGCASTSGENTVASADGFSGGAVRNELAMQDKAEMAPGGAGYASTSGIDAQVATTTPSAVQDRQIIKNASMNLTADAPKDVAEQIKKAATTAGGFIANSSLQDYAGGTQMVALTIRVPAKALDGLMDDIADLAKVEAENVSSADVTTEYIDLEARVAAMQSSVDRLDDLLKQTGNLTQLMQVESERANRQAELDSLRGQLKYLSEQVDLSTLEVSVQPTLGEAPVEEPEGFAGAFTRGWKDLKHDVALSITSVGYKLPYLLLVLLVFGPLGYAAYRFTRRWLRQEQARQAAKAAQLPPPPPTE